MFFDQTFLGKKFMSEYKEYFQNGKLKIICNYTDGKLCDEYKKYYKNGQLKIICNYVDGKKK